MNDRHEKALEEVKKEMKQTDDNEGIDETEPTTTEETPVKAKKTTKKSAAKKTAKKTTKPAAADDNSVKLKDVAKEFKIAPRDARKILRKEKVKNPGRWSWPDKSAELKRVRDLLGKAGK